MCECGCSNFAPDFQMPGPDGTIYAIRIYLSCETCDSPAGIDIDRLNATAVERWMDCPAPALPFRSVDEGMEGAAIPILHPRVLRRRLAGYLVGQEPIEDADHADIIAEEFLSEHFRDAITESMREMSDSLEPEPPVNTYGTEEQCPPIAPGHHWETRPDGTRTLRADEVLTPVPPVEGERGIVAALGPLPDGVDPAHVVFRAVVPPCPMDCYDHPDQVLVIQHGGLSGVGTVMAYSLYSAFRETPEWIVNSGERHAIMLLLAARTAQPARDGSKEPLMPDLTTLDKFRGLLLSLQRLVDDDLEWWTHLASARAEIASTLAALLAALPGLLAARTPDPDLARLAEENRRLRDALGLARPHVQMATSITSGREFKEETMRRLALIDAALPPGASDCTPPDPLCTLCGKARSAHRLAVLDDRTDMRVCDNGGLTIFPGGTAKP